MTNPNESVIAPPAARHRREPNKNIFAEWLGVLVAGFVIAMVLRAFVVQSFYIPSPSMENTLLVNDRIILNKLAYNYGSIKHGDIVVFRRPPGEADVEIKDLVKRVIALPGETIESRQGKVFINGQPIDEPYLKPKSVTNNLPSTVVPKGHVFVMGDNRNDSKDSRVFGPLSESLVEGRAVLRYKMWQLPPDRFAVL